MSAVIVAGEPMSRSSDEPSGAIRLATKIYVRLVLAGFALVPAYLIAYLFFFLDPTLKFEDHAFHVVAIG
jgi:two-component system cell cycle response regulator